MVRLCTIESKSKYNNSIQSDLIFDYLYFVLLSARHFICNILSAYFFKSYCSIRSSVLNIDKFKHNKSNTGYRFYIIIQYNI